MFCSIWDDEYRTATRHTGHGYSGQSNSCDIYSLWITVLLQSMWCPELQAHNIVLTIWCAQESSVMTMILLVLLNNRLKPVFRRSCAHQMVRTMLCACSSGHHIDWRASCHYAWNFKMNASLLITLPHP